MVLDLAASQAGAAQHTASGFAVIDRIPMRDPRGNTLRRGLKNRRTPAFEMHYAIPHISQKKRRLNRRRGAQVGI